MTAIFAALFMLAGGLLIAGAALVVAGQCFLWLSNGEWTGLTAAAGLAYFGPCPDACQAWLSSPAEWIGVQKILTGLPLSAAMLVLGLAALFVGTSIDEGAAQRARRRLTP